tara:strand:- start:1491 stop:1895 length:405 start_codon:yes stop_codon:yes gene_type:complete
MKKFKNLFIVAAIVDLLAIVPLILVSFNPEMMDEMVFSQMPGINDVGKDVITQIHVVFALIAVSMLFALITAVNIKVKESAQIAALILFIIHIGWVLPDWVFLVSGSIHPPLPVMILNSLSVLALGYAWKKGEV